MISIDPKEITTIKLHTYFLGAVGPRPIALASTMDERGRSNLSPFSFFNVFSVNPPVLIFSPTRNLRDNTIKHTLMNVEKIKEVVINVVNYSIAQQVSLSSIEYPEGVNEFIKSGLTPVPSHFVRPFRVGESPVQFECKVKQIVHLGNKWGAGNLVICEVVKLHIHENVLDDNGIIDPYKIDLVSRMGGDWYSRANKGLFEILKPVTTIGIGVEAIPDDIKNSTVFDGNDLGMLGNIEKLPTTEEINIFVEENFRIKGILSSDDENKIHLKAKEYLYNQDILSAWKMLLAKK